MSTVSKLAIFAATLALSAFHGSSFAQRSAGAADVCRQCPLPSIPGSAPSRTDPRARILDDLNAKLKANDQLRDFGVKAIEQIGNAWRDNRRSDVPRSNSRDDYSDSERDYAPPSRSQDSRDQQPYDERPRRSDSVPSRRPDSPRSDPVPARQPDPPRSARAIEPSTPPLPTDGDVQRAFAPQIDSILSDLNSAQRDLEVFKMVDPASILMSVVHASRADTLPASGAFRAAYEMILGSIDRVRSDSADPWSNGRVDPSVSLREQIADSVNSARSGAGDWVGNARTKMFDLFWNGSLCREIQYVRDRCNNTISDDLATGDAATDAAAGQFSASASPCRLFVRTFPGRGVGAIRGIERYESDYMEPFGNVVSRIAPESR